MITICSMRSASIEDGNDYRCDRGTDLGNPFPMHNESQRDAVCEKYSQYFKDKKLWETPLFRSMLHKVKLGQDIRLFCWCAPKRCHLETIKAALEYFAVN